MFANQIAINYVVLVHYTTRESGKTIDRLMDLYSIVCIIRPLGSCVNLQEHNINTMVMC